MAIDIGYRYKHIHNVEFEIDEDSENVINAIDEGAEKDYKSHNVLIGLRFGF
jgi:opacity protein-like surface antigen